MMDEALKEEWIEALRDGRYRQGRQFFRCGDRYCAMGVLHELRGGEWRGDQALLNADHWVDSFEPVGVDADSAHTIALMNDNGSSFEEIADFIETNL